MYRTWRQGSGAVALLAITSWGLAGSCTSSESSASHDDPGGLVQAASAEPRPIDVARAGRDPDELVRAARMPHRRVAAALGAHRARATTTVTVREGDTAVEELEVTTAIEIDAGGAFHALSQNSKDYGREVYYKDGYLYLAPRYSKFHRRRPNNPDEPAAIRDQMYAELGAHLELIAPGIEVEDLGQVSHTNRSARKIAVTRAQEQRQSEPSASAAPQRAWRRDVVIEAAQGEIVLDADTGVPLAATVSGAVRFQRDGRTFTMSFEVEHFIEHIGEDFSEHMGDIPVPGPERWVATPLRSREVEERDTLLEGIAPPARKSRPPQRAGDSR